MARAWSTWGAVIVVSLCAVPACLALAAWLARFRGRRAAFAEVAIVAGTLPSLWMVLTPRQGSSGLQLVPLRDLAAVLSDTPGAATVQMVGNLLVFAALGCFLPVRHRVGLATVALSACAGSAGIETAQALLELGRVTSIDDVLLNTAGAVLAALASRHWWREPPADPSPTPPPMSPDPAP